MTIEEKSSRVKKVFEFQKEVFQNITIENYFDSIKNKTIRASKANYYCSSNYKKCVNTIKRPLS